MKETIKTIIEWQEQTFPDATLEGQIEKFKDERQEFYDSFNDKELSITELADMFIVACGISRFDALKGVLHLWETLSTALDFKVNWKDLLDTVDVKMKINRARNWEKKDGKYQHKEEGNDL